MALATPRKSLEPWLSDEVHYYDHQVEGVRWMMKQRNAIIADEMGTGKSLQALTTFVVDVKRGWAQTCLIVCPIILKANWLAEISKFTTIPATVLEGNAEERAFTIARFMMDSGPRILIVHYEQLASEVEMLNAINFDIAIYDEAHVIKNPKAKRTEAFLKMWSHRSLVLTGTPMLNGIPDLWTLLHKVDPKQFSEFYNFVNRYAVFGGYNGKQLTTAVKNEADLIERLNRVMIRRLKAEVLDLPEVNVVTRVVDLYDQQKDIYDLVKDGSLVPRPEGVDDEEIEWQIVKFVRLKQVCGNTMLFNGEDISAKMDAAIVDDADVIAHGEKLVIFTQFRDTLEIYANRLRTQWPDLPIFELHGSVPESDRHAMTQRWANVTGPAVIVCMLQVAGVGLNMVAARNVSFLDELFVPGLNQQAIDRVHRIGQDKTQPVTVRRYICNGTIEERIQQILRTKSRLIAGIVETDPDWKRKLVELMEED